MRPAVSGDVLGCRIDLDRKSGHCRIGYSHNGMDLGWAYSNVDLSVGDKLMPLRPEVSLNQQNPGLRLNFGQRADSPLQHCPAGFLPLACAVQGGHKLPASHVLALNDELAEKFAARKAPGAASEAVDLPSYADRYLSKNLDYPRPQLSTAPCIRLRADSGLTFDDTSERLHSNKQLTVEMLVSVQNTTTERQLLVSRGRVWQHQNVEPSKKSVGGWSLSIVEGGALEFAARQGSDPAEIVTSEPGAIDKNQWTHVAVSFMAGRVNLLVNGASVATGGFEKFPLLPSGTNLYYIGCNNPPATKGRKGDKQPPVYAMLGRIALLRVWRTARSSDEIAATMGRCALQKTDHTMSLAAELRMLEGSGNRLFSADGAVVIKTAGNGAEWGGVMQKADLRALASKPEETSQRPEAIATKYGAERLQQTANVANALKAVLAVGVPAEAKNTEEESPGAAAADASVGATESKAESEGPTQPDLPAALDMSAVAGMTPPFMGTSLLHSPRWAPHVGAGACRADLFAAQITGTLMRLLDEHSLAVMVEAMGTVAAIGVPPPPHGYIHDPSPRSIVLLCSLCNIALEKLVAPNIGTSSEAAAGPSPCAVLGANIVLMCMRLLRETMSVAKHCVVAAASNASYGPSSKSAATFFGGQGIDVLIPTSIVQRHVLPTLCSVVHTLAGALPLLPEEAMYGLGWGNQDLAVRLSSVFGIVQMAAAGIVSMDPVSSTDPGLNADVWAALLRTTRDTAAAVLVEDVRTYLPGATDVSYLLTRLLSVAERIPEHLPWVPPAAEAKAREALEAIRSAGDKKGDKEKALLAAMQSASLENVSLEAVRPAQLVVPASSSLDDLTNGPGAYHMLYMLLQWLSGHFSVPSTREARKVVKQIHQHGIVHAMSQMDQATAEQLADELSSTGEAPSWQEGKGKSSSRTAAWFALVRGTCGVLPSCAALPLSSTTLPSAWEGRAAGFESLIALLAPGDVSIGCTFSAEGVSAQHSSSSVLSFSTEGRSSFGAVASASSGFGGGFGAQSTAQSGTDTLWGELAETRGSSATTVKAPHMSQNSPWGQFQPSTLDVLLDVRGDGLWAAHRRSIQTRSSAGASSANSAWQSQHFVPFARASAGPSPAPEPASTPVVAGPAMQTVRELCSEFTDLVLEKTALSASTSAKWGEMSSEVVSREEGKSVKACTPASGGNAGSGSRCDSRRLQYAAGAHVMTSGSVHSATFKLSSFVNKDNREADNVPTVFFGFATHPVNPSQLDFTKSGSRTVGLTVGPSTRVDSSMTSHSGTARKSSYTAAGNGFGFGAASGGYGSSFSSSPKVRPGGTWCQGSTSTSLMVPDAQDLVESDTVTLTLNLSDSLLGGHISVLLNGKTTHVRQGMFFGQNSISCIPRMKVLRDLEKKQGDKPASGGTQYAYCNGHDKTGTRNSDGSMAMPWQLTHRPSATPARHFAAPKNDDDIELISASSRVPIAQNLLSTFGKSTKYVPVVIFLGTSTGDRPIVVELSELMEYKMAPKNASSTAPEETTAAVGESKEEETTGAAESKDDEEADAAVGASSEDSEPVLDAQAALPAVEDLPFTPEAVLEGLVLGTARQGGITPLAVASAILSAASVEGRPAFNVLSEGGTLEALDALSAADAAAAFRDATLPVTVEAWRVACLGSSEAQVPDTPEEFAECMSPDALAALYQRLYTACTAAPTVLRAAALAPELQFFQQPQAVPLGSDTNLTLPSARAPSSLVDAQDTTASLRARWAVSPSYRAAATFALWQRRSVHRLVEQLTSVAVGMSSQVQLLSQSPFMRASQRAVTSAGRIPSQVCLPMHPALSMLRALGEVCTGFAPLRPQGSIAPVSGPAAEFEFSPNASGATDPTLGFSSQKAPKGHEKVAMVESGAPHLQAASAGAVASAKAPVPASQYGLPLVQLSRLRLPRVADAACGELVEQSVAWSNENTLSKHVCNPYLTASASSALDEALVDHMNSSDRVHLLQAVNRSWLKQTAKEGSSSGKDDESFKFWTDLPLAKHPELQTVEVSKSGLIVKPCGPATRSSWSTVLTQKPIVNAMASPPPADTSVPFVGQHGLVTVAFRMAAGATKRNAMVGVALPDCGKSTYLGADNQGYGLLLRGDAFHRSTGGSGASSRLEKYCPRATGSTALLCQLDYTNKSVKWGHASLSDMAQCQADAQAMYAKQAAKLETADGTAGAEKLTQEEMDAVLAAACAEEDSSTVRARYLLSNSTVTWFPVAFSDLEIGSTIHAGITLHGEGDAMEILGYAIDDNAQPDFSAEKSAQAPCCGSLLNSQGVISARAIVEAFQAGSGLHTLALDPASQSGPGVSSGWNSLATAISARGMPSRSSAATTLLPAAGAMYTRVVLRAVQSLLGPSADLCTSVLDDSLPADQWSAASVELQRLACHPLLKQVATPAIATLMLFRKRVLMQAVEAVQPELESVAFLMTRIAQAIEKIVEHNLAAHWRSSVRNALRAVRSKMEAADDGDAADDEQPTPGLDSLQLLRQPSEGPPMDGSSTRGDALPAQPPALMASVSAVSDGVVREYSTPKLSVFELFFTVLGLSAECKRAAMPMLSRAATAVLTARYTPIGGLSALRSVQMLGTLAMSAAVELPSSLVRVSDADIQLQIGLSGHVDMLDANELAESSKAVEAALSAESKVDRLTTLAGGASAQGIVQQQLFQGGFVGEHLSEIPTQSGAVTADGAALTAEQQFLLDLVDNKAGTAAADLHKVMKTKAGCKDAGALRKKLAPYDGVGRATTAAVLHHCNATTAAMAFAKRLSGGEANAGATPEVLMTAWSAAKAARQLWHSTVSSSKQTAAADSSAPAKAASSDSIALPDWSAGEACRHVARRARFLVTAFAPATAAGALPAMASTKMAASDVVDAVKAFVQHPSVSLRKLRVLALRTGVLVNNAEYGMGSLLGTLQRFNAEFGPATGTARLIPVMQTILLDGSNEQLLTASVPMWSVSVSKKSGAGAGSAVMYPWSVRVSRSSTHSIMSVDPGLNARKSQRYGRSFPSICQRSAQRLHSARCALWKGAIPAIEQVSAAFRDVCLQLPAHFVMQWLHGSSSGPHAPKAQLPMLPGSSVDVSSDVRSTAVTLLEHSLLQAGAESIQAQLAAPKLLHIVSSACTLMAAITTHMTPDMVPVVAAQGLIPALTALLTRVRAVTGGHFAHKALQHAAVEDVAWTSVTLKESSLISRIGPAVSFLEHAAVASLSAVLLQSSALLESPPTMQLLSSTSSTQTQLLAAANSEGTGVDGSVPPPPLPHSLIASSSLTVGDSVNNAGVPAEAQMPTAQSYVAALADSQDSIARLLSGQAMEGDSAALPHAAFVVVYTQLREALSVLMRIEDWRRKHLVPSAVARSIYSSASKSAKSAAVSRESALALLGDAEPKAPPAEPVAAESKAEEDTGEVESKLSDAPAQPPQMQSRNTPAAGGFSFNNQASGRVAASPFGSAQDSLVHLPSGRELAGSMLASPPSAASFYSAASEQDLSGGLMDFLSAQQQQSQPEGGIPPPTRSSGLFGSTRSVLPSSVADFSQALRAAGSREGAQLAAQQLMMEEQMLQMREASGRGRGRGGGARAKSGRSTGGKAPMKAAVKAPAKFAATSGTLKSKSSSKSTLAQLTRTSLERSSSTGSAAADTEWTRGWDVPSAWGWEEAGAVSSKPETPTDEDSPPAPSESQPFTKNATVDAEIGAADTVLSELSGVLPILAAMPASSQHLCTGPWLSLMLFSAHYGPLTVQRRMLRLMRTVLPSTTPSTVSVALPHDRWQDTTASASESKAVDAQGLVKFLIFELARAHAPGVFADKHWLELMRSRLLNVTSDVLQEDEDLLTTIASSEHIRADTWAIDVPSPYRCGQTASELVALLRALLSRAEWRGLVSAEMELLLGQALEKDVHNNAELLTPDREDSQVSGALAAAASVAAGRAVLSVCGGFTEPVRAGGLVELLPAAVSGADQYALRNVDVFGNQSLFSHAVNSMCDKVSARVQRRGGTGVIAGLEQSHEFVASVVVDWEPAEDEEFQKAMRACEPASAAVSDTPLVLPQVVMTVHMSCLSPLPHLPVQPSHIPTRLWPTLTAAAVEWGMSDDMAVASFKSTASAAAHTGADVDGKLAAVGSVGLAGAHVNPAELPRLQEDGTLVLPEEDSAPMEESKEGTAAAAPSEPVPAPEGAVSDLNLALTLHPVPRRLTPSGCIGLDTSDHSSGLTVVMDGDDSELSVAVLDTIMTEGVWLWEMQVVADSRGDEGVQLGLVRQPYPNSADAHTALHVQAGQGYARGFDGAECSIDTPDNFAAFGAAAVPLDKRTEVIQKNYIMRFSEGDWVRFVFDADNGALFMAVRHGEESRAAMQLMAQRIKSNAEKVGIELDSSAIGLRMLEAEINEDPPFGAADCGWVDIGQVATAEPGMPVQPALFAWAAGKVVDVTGLAQVVAAELPSLPDKAPTLRQESSMDSVCATLSVPKLAPLLDGGLLYQSGVESLLALRTMCLHLPFARRFLADDTVEDAGIGGGLQARQLLIRSALQITEASGLADRAAMEEMLLVQSGALVDRSKRAALAGAVDDIRDSDQLLRNSGSVLRAAAAVSADPGIYVERPVSALAPASPTQGGAKQDDVPTGTTPIPEAMSPFPPSEMSSGMDTAPRQRLSSSSRPDAPSPAGAGLFATPMQSVQAPPAPGAGSTPASALPALAESPVLASSPESPRQSMLTPAGMLSTPIMPLAQLNTPAQPAPAAAQPDAAASADAAAVSPADTTEDTAGSSGSSPCSQGAEGQAQTTTATPAAASGVAGFMSALESAAPEELAAATEQAADQSASDEAESLAAMEAARIAEQAAAEEMQAAADSAVEDIMGFGFERAAVEAALAVCGGDAAAAADMLFSNGGQIPELPAGLGEPASFGFGVQMGEGGDMPSMQAPSQLNQLGVGEDNTGSLGEMRFGEEQQTYEEDNDEDDEDDEDEEEASVYSESACSESSASSYGQDMGSPPPASMPIKPGAMLTAVESDDDGSGVEDFLEEETGGEHYNPSGRFFPDTRPPFSRSSRREFGSGGQFGASDQGKAVQSDKDDRAFLGLDSADAETTDVRASQRAACGSRNSVFGGMSSPYQMIRTLASKKDIREVRARVMVTATNLVALAAREALVCLILQWPRCKAETDTSLPPPAQVGLSRGDSLAASIGDMVPVSGPTAFSVLEFFGSEVFVSGWDRAPLYAGPYGTGMPLKPTDPQMPAHPLADSINDGKQPLKLSRKARKAQQYLSVSSVLQTPVTAFLALLRLETGRGFSPVWWPPVNTATPAGGSSTTDSGLPPMPAGLKGVALTSTLSGLSTGENAASGGAGGSASPWLNEEGQHTVGIAGSSCLDGSKPSLQSLLHSVLQQAMASTAVLPSADADSAQPVRTVGATLRLTAAEALETQLRQAAHREFASFNWSGHASMSFKDSSIVMQPSLKFIQWLTDILLSTNTADKLQAPTQAAAQEADAALQELFSAWAVTLRSPSMGLKEAGFRRLSDILGRAWRLEQAAQANDKPSPVRWEEYLMRVHAPRIEALAQRRLHSEMEDAPRCSRYLQTLLEFAAMLRFAQQRADATTASSEGARKVEKAASGTALRFQGGMSYVTCQGVRGPSNFTGDWTLELWVRRRGKAGALAGQTIECPSDDEEAPVQLAAEGGTLQVSGDSRRDAEDSGMGFGRKATKAPAFKGGFGAPPAASQPADDTKSTKKHGEAKVLAMSSDGFSLLLECGGACKDDKRSVGIRLPPGVSLLAPPTGSGTRGRGKAKGERRRAARRKPTGQEHSLPGGAKMVQSAQGEIVSFGYEAPPSQWVHLAFVFNGKSISLAVNGRRKGAARTHTVNIANRMKLALPMAEIGSRVSAMRADLMEVRMWRAARTPGEIKRDLGSMLPKDSLPGALAGYLRMAEGMGTYISDFTEQNDRCFARGTSWVKVASPPVEPQDNLSGVADAAALETVEGVSMAATAGPATPPDGEGPTVVDTPAEVASALDDAYSGDASAWREFVGHMQRSACPELGGNWKQAGRQAVHVKWRRIDAADKQADALAVLQQLNTQFAKHSNGHAVDIVQEDAAESKEEEASSAAESKDSDLAPASGSGVNTAVAVSSIPANAVLVTGEVQLPEVQAQAPIVGWFAPVDTWAPSRREPLVDVMRNDGKLVFFLRKLLTGPPDALSYLPGARFEGSRFGETLSGSWRSSAMKAAAEPRVPGKAWLHESLHADDMQITGTTMQAAGSSWVTSVACLNPPAHAAAGRTAAGGSAAGEEETPEASEASEGALQRSRSTKAPSKEVQQKNWDEVMAGALTSGSWSFDVRVESVASAVSVGVATRGAVVRNYLGCERQSWGFQSNAQRYHKGSSDSYGASYSAGSIVTTHVDMDKGHLEFFVDGASQGIAYTDLKAQAMERDELKSIPLGQGVVPAVSLSSRGDSATMLGLKTGAGVRTWASDMKNVDGKVRFDGLWYMGQTHGMGALQVNKPDAGTWQGTWRRGEMHGVYKWTPSDDSAGVKYIKFAKGIKGEDSTEAAYEADVAEFNTSHAAMLKELAASAEKPKRQAPKRVEISGSFCVDKDSLFVWMPSASARNVTVTDDLKTVSQSRGGSGVVIGSRGFSGGVHYWEIHLKSEFTDDGRMLHENLMMNTGGAMLYIGVAERRQGDYSSWRDYGYMNYMAVKSSFASERLYGQHMMPNDRIGVLLNMDEGTLTFTRDGSMFGEYKYDNFGPAFRYVRSGAKGGPLSRVLYPVIGLSSPCDPVTIKATKWLSIPAKLPSAHLSSVLEAATLLQLWDRPANTRAEVPEHIVQEGFDRWVAMLGGHRVEATTRIGVAVRYDRSSAACGRVLRCMNVERESLQALRGGDRVQFEGKGTAIVGAYRDRLWYRKDGQSEVWYFHHGDFEEMQLESRPESAQVEDAAELAAAEAADKAWTAAVAGGALATSASLAVLQGEEATLDKFQALLANPCWTVEADLALVCVVNDQCDEGGVEPENLKLRTAAEGEGHPGWMTDAANLPTMCARFALLLRLNARLGSLLPLVDMTVRRSHLISTQSEKITFASALGKRVANLRGLAFTRTKLAYWRRVLAATVLYTEPASENFSRAPDVPELAVNRVRARVETLAKIDSVRKRLKTSVFGQLMDQTSSWRADQFRRDYSYEADLGQQRNFFVKLQNEGADDNGGPYRAVIEAASAAEAAGPLSLLVPCNNARTGRGKNRDKFVFNLGPFGVDEEEGRASKGGADAGAAEEAVRLAAEANKRQLRFLGLLAGTALRHDALMAVNLPQAVWRPLVGMSVEHSHVFELDYDFANTIALVNAVPAVPEGGAAAGSAEAAAAALRSLQEAALSAVANLQGVEASRLARLRRAASRLTFAKRETFVDALVEATGRASEEHMASFMHGLGAVVPHELLPLFTPEELETLLAGKPHVDVSILKRAVKYEGGLNAEHETVKALWQVLENMPQPMLRKFLDFVSARKRLPRSPDGFQQPFKVTSLGAEAAESGKLPKGISCFFTLQLPEYTDPQRLRDKLETGILNSWTMDADWQVGAQGGGVMEGFDSLDTIEEEDAAGAASS